MEQNETYPQESSHPVAGRTSAPTDVQMADRWLKMIVSTQDPNEALEYAQRAVDVKPDDPKVRASLLRAVEEKLKRDPYVAFLAETDANYVVTFRKQRPIVVPKSRATREIFPPPQRTEGERVLGMIWWVVLGLLPAGLGAIVTSPIVLRRAAHIIVSQRGKDPREQRLAWLAIFLAAGLGCLGELFGALFIIHLIG